jgi:hypothetical protein
MQLIIAQVVKRDIGLARSRFHTAMPAQGRQ